MDNNQLGYAVLEVGGIQNFILRTGKLKEMIAGSELVASLSESFLDARFDAEKLKPIPAAEARRPEAGEVLVAQSSAGTVHLLFSDVGTAKAFVTSFCLEALERYPGIPLYAAVEGCTWTRESIDRARTTVGQKIQEKRSTASPATGLPTHPVCRTARLDGLPAVAVDGDETVSLLSATKRAKDLVEAANERLRSVDRDAVEQALGTLDAFDWGRWIFDTEKIADANGKVAYVHLDGNDLGALFKRKRQSLDGVRDPAEAMRKMGKLSSLVTRATRAAFEIALGAVLHFDLYRLAPDSKKSSVIPVRPLVLGGDDVTCVMKADLALLFVRTFVVHFERLTKELGEPLSVGGGMVVCPAGYPFLKAYDLVEELTKNAKNLTVSDQGTRESSFDYVVLTNDAEKSLSDLRRHIQTASDGSSLTGKPFRMSGNSFHDFIRDGRVVLERLPRSNLRPAMNDCRRGVAAARDAWLRLVRNAERGLGGRGRGGAIPSVAVLEGLFHKEGFFRTRGGKKWTPLADYLELEHLLPSRERDEYLRLMESRRDVREAGHAV